jgi:hypothetical protein
MRLAIIDSGHGFGTKVFFALIRAISRQPVLDVIKLVKYRADFYGKPMQGVTHEAMRGPSAWSVGDRELMAAFIAKTNKCEWCTKAHVSFPACGHSCLAVLTSEVPRRTKRS